MKYIMEVLGLSCQNIGAFYRGMFVWDYGLGSVVDIEKHGSSVETSDDCVLNLYDDV